MVASVCPSCIQGYRLAGEPTGEMVSVGDQQAYLRTGASQGSKTVVILPDAFGLPIPNAQIIADRLSEKFGMDVYVPDIYHGRPPLSPERMIPTTNEEPGMTTPLWKKLQMNWVILTSLPGLYANRPAVLNARIEKFLLDLEEKGYTDIGVVGYCMGGSAAIQVATTTLAKTVVIAHPGPSSIADVKKVQVPTSWICAEEDGFFYPAYRKECESVLTAKDGVPCEFVDYKGTVHGFALRPNQNLPIIRDAFEAALQQVVVWFQKML